MRARTLFKDRKPYSAADQELHIIKGLLCAALMFARSCREPAQERFFFLCE